MLPTAGNRPLFFGLQLPVLLISETTWSVGLELTRKMHAYKASNSPEHRSPISHEKGTPSLKCPLDSSSPGPSMPNRTNAT